MLASKVGAFLSETLKGATLWGWLLAIPAKIRLGRKSLPGTYTPAYWDILYVLKKIKCCE
jgi:hypothetical protein